MWEFDKNSTQKNTYEVASGSLNIFSGMLELEDRIYFISSNKEILIFDKTTKKTKTLVKLGTFKEVSFGAVKPWKKDKALIITRYGGLYALNLVNDQLERIHETKISDQWQHDVLTHNDGSIWIGTIESIFVLSSDGETVSLYDPKIISSKREKHVFGMKKDREGVIWLGTGHGLVKIQDKKETLYNMSNSDLLVNSILDIEFDKHSNLWVKTRKGVSKIDPKSMKMVHFDKSDGIDSEGILKSVDGEVYYGTLGGYYNLSEEFGSLSKKTPNIYFTKFLVLGKKKQLESAIDYTPKIDLSYHENSFAFSFVSPTLSEPQKIKYAYRLLGLDKDWVIDQKRRYANYTNLDGGTYVFEVKAGTRDGQWSETRKITINVASPFWETWWFYLLCSITILGAGLAFYKTRVNILQRRADQEAQELRLEAFQKRLMELNAAPPDLVLDFDKLNNKLNTPLSEREFEALKLSLDGKSNAEISEELFISNSTVKFHLRNTYSKLGVANRKEAFQFILNKA